MYYLLVILFITLANVSYIDGLDFECHWEIGYNYDGFAMRLKVSLQSIGFLLSTILFPLRRLAMETI